MCIRDRAVIDDLVTSRQTNGASKLTNHLAAVSSSKGVVDFDTDVLADEVHRAVGENHLSTSDMLATRREVGAAKTG